VTNGTDEIKYVLCVGVAGVFGVGYSVWWWGPVVGSFAHNYENSCFMTGGFLTRL
jgi:hypothetical protein